MEVLILATTCAVGALLLWPRLANAPLWRATITPLASIIGSGFLVLGPILLLSYGAWSPLVMLALCAAAYAFGGAIRFNIDRLSQTPARSPWEGRLEHISSLALGLAYVISVAYYLNLFGAFAVAMTPLDSPFYARLVTSAAFVFILTLGLWRGFHAMERVEQISVGVKLAIIMGLLAALAVYFGGKWQSGGLIHSAASLSGWPAVTLLFGLIVTVQGFETSRYLSDSYPAALRQRSMKLAQLLSTLIYMGYILLLSSSFSAANMSHDETAIIQLMALVSPLLPGLLIAAALSAQFSAAVADTGGAGGIFVEASGRRISAKSGYALLTAIGLVMTWTADVFSIISYASRAFAAYYMLQSAIAAIGAAQEQKPLRALAFGLLAGLALLITLFGSEVE